MKTKTAAELMAELATDGKYQETIQKKEAELAVLDELLARDEAGLVAELSVVLGHKVDSVYDLVNRPND